MWIFKQFLTLLLRHNHKVVTRCRNTQQWNEYVRNKHNNNCFLKGEEDNSAWVRTAEKCSKSVLSIIAKLGYSANSSCKDLFYMKHFESTTNLIVKDKIISTPSSNEYFYQFIIYCFCSSNIFIGMQKII